MEQPNAPRVKAEKIVIRASSSDWPPEALETLDGCPLCGAAERTLVHASLQDRIFGASGNWQMWQCIRCASGYLDPRPNEANIGQAYQIYYTHKPNTSEQPGTFSAEVRTALANDYRNCRYGTERRPVIPGGRLLAGLIPALAAPIDQTFRFLPTGSRGRRLLDVGCGSGDFLALAAEAGWLAVGTEPDPAARDQGRRRGFDVYESLEDLTAEVPFDAITLNHVIEHVHRPDEVLVRCATLLRPGGQIFVATPNMLALGHHLWGEDWRGLEPPRHLVMFTPESLTHAVRAAGFVGMRLLPTPGGLQSLWEESQAIRKARNADLPSPSSPKAAIGRAAQHDDRREFLVLLAQRAA